MNRFQVFAKSASSLYLAFLLVSGALGVISLASANAQIAPKSVALTGTVIDATSKQPLDSVLVQVAGTSSRAITDASGRFTINSAPTGLLRIEARKNGFAIAFIDNVSAQSSRSPTVRLELTRTSFRTNTLTDAATLHPLLTRDAPFAIDHLSAVDMPVPGANIADMLAGKVPGITLTRSSGEPGAENAIQLRGVSSLYRYGTPMIIVDGVILSRDFPLTEQDIEGLDIESIEVIRGGTASALYGARALDGVIDVRTKRGAATTTSRPQFTLRNEVGRDFVGDWIDERLAHPYRVNASGQYVNANGAVVSRSQRVLQANGIAENRYLAPTYDHGQQFFRDNVVNNQSIGVQQNLPLTNYNVSYSRNRQPGVAPGTDGYTRQSVRVNIDQHIAKRVLVGLSASHTTGNEQPSVISTLDLALLEADENLLDNTSSAGGLLSVQLANNDRIRRNRTWLNGTASVRLLDWLSLEALASTDRGSRRDRIDFNSVFAPNASGGYAQRDDSTLSERYQYGIGLQRKVGRLSSRIDLRGESRYARSTLNEITASNVDSSGKPTTTGTHSEVSSSSTTAILGNANLGFDDRFTGDVVVRQDRSGAYGVKGDPTTSVRAGAAWLLNNESWFVGSNISLLRLRYSGGFANTLPESQIIYYSPFDPPPPKLKNDSRIEHEFGLDVGINQRVTASLTYAPYTAKGNVLAGYALNFGDIVPRKGRITGNTLEATIQDIISESTTGLRWITSITGSRTRARIADFPSTCYIDQILRFCDATSLGAMWGNRLIRKKSELRSIHANSNAAFDVNDDGYVVPVGAGNSWRDGKAKSLWGTNVSIDGRTYPWGLPIVVTDIEGQMLIEPIGNSLPDLQFGVQNRMEYKGLRFYTQFVGQVGGDSYNNAKQILYYRGNHVDVDQTSKPDETRKSVAYYRAVAGNNSGYLQNFVESATNLRLAEATLGYSFTANRFGFVRRIGADHVQLDVVGRNLFTAGGVSTLPSNMVFGSPVLNFGYPLARTFTLATSITF